MEEHEDSLPDGWTEAEREPESRQAYDARPHDLYERTDADVRLQVSPANPEGARGDTDDYRVQVIAGDDRTAVEVDGHDSAMEVAHEFMGRYDGRSAGDDPGEVLTSVED